MRSSTCNDCVAFREDPCSSPTARGEACSERKGREERPLSDPGAPLLTCSPKTPRRSPACTHSNASKAEHSHRRLLVPRQSKQKLPPVFPSFGRVASKVLTAGEFEEQPFREGIPQLRSPAAGVSSNAHHGAPGPISPQSSSSAICVRGSDAPGSMGTCCAAWEAGSEASFLSTGDDNSEGESEVLASPGDSAEVSSRLRRQWRQVNLLRSFGTFLYRVFSLDLHFLLSFPLFLCLTGLLLLEGMIYVCVRLAGRWTETSLTPWRVKRLQRLLKCTTRYDGYFNLASQLDRVTGREQWKDADKDKFYDWRNVVKRTELLRRYQLNEDYRGMLRCLRTILLHDCYRTFDEHLYACTYIGTKRAVEDFHAEMLKSISMLSRRLQDLRAGRPRFHSSSKGLEDRLRRVPPAYSSSSGKFSTQTLSGGFAVSSRDIMNTTTDDTLLDSGCGSCSQPPGDGGDSLQSPDGPTTLVAHVARRQTRREFSDALECSASVSTLGVAQALRCSVSVPQMERFERRPPTSGSRRRRRNELSQFCSGCEELAQLFGVSCLALSGGAQLGLHHFGVLEVLVRNSMLPKIISGTSAGAVVAALICSRTDPEFLAFLTSPAEMARFSGVWSPNRWLCRFFHYIRTGHAIDIDLWDRRIADLFGDMTLEEAYLKTGRMLNIGLTRAVKDHVTGSEPLVLNVLSAPRVLIRSAIMCSVQFPFLGSPLLLLEKRKDGVIHDSAAFVDCYFHDGSLQADIPAEVMRKRLGVKYLIVSQVNIHVFPFLGLRAHGSAGDPLRGWRSLVVAAKSNIDKEKKEDSECDAGRRRNSRNRKTVTSATMTTTTTATTTSRSQNIGSSGALGAHGGSRAVWRGGFLLASVEVALKEHLRYLLRLISVLDVSPTLKGINIGHVASQTYGGDLSLFPRSLHLNHLLYFMNNVPDHVIKWFVHTGKQMIFPKMSLLKSRIAIEHSLEALRVLARDTMQS